MPNKTLITGQWQLLESGKWGLAGTSTITTPSGNTGTGTINYADGHLTISGEGQIESPDGTIYKGQWGHIPSLGSWLVGESIQILPDGSIFNGTWTYLDKKMVFSINSQNNTPKFANNSST